MEDLLADAVRLATQTGDLITARSLAGQAAALAAGSKIRTGKPARCTAEA